MKKKQKKHKKSLNFQRKMVLDATWPRADSGLPGECLGTDWGLTGDWLGTDWGLTGDPLRSPLSQVFAMSTKILKIHWKIKKNKKTYFFNFFMFFFSDFCFFFFDFWYFSLIFLNFHAFWVCLIHFVPVSFILGYGWLISLNFEPFWSILITFYPFTINFNILNYCWLCLWSF